MKQMWHTVCANDLTLFLLAPEKGGVVSVPLNTNEGDRSLILPFGPSEAGRGLKY